MNHIKKASLVSIGNKLLNGSCLDTNAVYLAGQLLTLGIPVTGTYVVGDDMDSIVLSLQRAASDADVVLVTGGLGPTDDDLTRAALAKFLGVELQFQDRLLREIQDFFARRNLTMPPKNKAQACLPAGCQPLPNPLGTAPGIFAPMQDKLLFALPGVPAEMKQMFEQSIVPVLHSLAGRQAIVVKKLRCIGKGESQIAEMLGSLMERSRNPLINCTVSAGVITLHIIATAADKTAAQRLVDDDYRFIKNLLGSLIFGADDQTLAQVVGAELAARKKTLAVAESCTGGLLAKLITDVPGSSDYFLQAWVTYSNQSKISLLGVPAQTIEKFGAVSVQTAEAMACCARQKACADFALAVTGIAGPTGGSYEKPVGLAYIAIDSDQGCQVERFVFSGDRDLVRIKAAQTALNLLRLRLAV